MKFLRKFFNDVFVLVYVVDELCDDVEVLNEELYVLISLYEIFIVDLKEARVDEFDLNVVSLGNDLV